MAVFVFEDLVAGYCFKLYVSDGCGSIETLTVNLRLKIENVGQIIFF